MEQGAPRQREAAQCQPSHLCPGHHTQVCVHSTGKQLPMHMDSSWLPSFRAEEGNTSNLDILWWPVHSSKHIWPFLYRLRGTKAERSTLFEIQILISPYQHWYYETEVWAYFLPHLVFSLWLSYIEIWYFISNIIWKAELSRIHTNTSLVNLPSEKETTLLLLFNTKLLLDGLGLFFLKQQHLALERKDCSYQENMRLQTVSKNTNILAKMINLGGSRQYYLHRKQAQGLLVRPTLTKAAVFLEWFPFITLLVSIASWFTDYTHKTKANH